MRYPRLTLLATVLCVALLVAACSNPADNVPEARVSEPAAESAAPVTPASAPTSAPASAPTSMPASMPASMPTSMPTDEPTSHPRMFDIAPESTISFVGSKVTRSHDGGFKVLTGQIAVVPDDITRSMVALRIDTTSMWTDTDKLTEHLKSPDFFDVAKYPAAKFRSTQIEKTESGYNVTGGLLLHGVHKQITFPAQIEVAEDRVTAKAEFSIKRFDFGIVYPGKADDLIRDEVVIKLDIVGMPAV